jgi:hypothetical protein
MEATKFIIKLFKHTDLHTKFKTNNFIELSLKIKRQNRPNEYADYGLCFILLKTVLCHKYRISQSNRMHTLLYTERFKLHSYMFRTVNWFVFRESHNFTNHTYSQQYDHKTC